MKRCTRCNRYKEETSFYKNIRQTDGLQTYCKVCSIKTQKARYAKDPNGCTKAVMRWQKENYYYVRYYHKMWRRKTNKTNKKEKI